METTEKQIAANRENGKQGGVKTEAGKRISRMNGLKHGLLASMENSFDKASLSAVHEMLLDEFGGENPSPSKLMLIEQLTHTYLRIAKCAKAEKQVLNELTAEIKKATYEEEILNTSAFQLGEKPIPLGEVITRFTIIFDRYEPRLVSRFLKLIKAIREY